MHYRQLSSYIKMVMYYPTSNTHLNKLNAQRNPLSLARYLPNDLEIVLQQNITQYKCSFLYKLFL